MKTRQEYEAKLTPENIAKAVRYLTRCLDGSQLEQALINTIKIHKGKPISNSLLLHELVEAEEFEALGYSFASAGLENMTYREKERLHELHEQIRGIYFKIREPHLIALREQHAYFAAIARERGHSLSIGSILRFSPISPRAEIDEVVRFDPSLKSDYTEHNQAQQFILELLEEEPDYEEIFSGILKGENTSGSYLYDSISQSIVT